MGLRDGIWLIPALLSGDCFGGGGWLSNLFGVT